MSQEEFLQNNPEKIPGEGGSTEGEPGNEEKKKPIWPWILGIFVVLVIGGLVLLALSLQTTQTAEDDSWERVKLAGVLRVGLLHLLLNAGEGRLGLLGFLQQARLVDTVVEPAVGDPPLERFLFTLPGFHDAGFSTGDGPWNA